MARNPIWEVNMKKTGFLIQEKAESILLDMLEYAEQMPLSEENMLFKKEVLQLALNYLKSKKDEGMGSFFESLFADNKEQELDEELIAQERLGTSKKTKGRKTKTKIEEE